MNISENLFTPISKAFYQELKKNPNFVTKVFYSIKEEEGFVNVEKSTYKLAKKCNEEVKAEYFAKRNVPQPTSASSFGNLSVLPLEILHHIFSFMNFTELSKVKTASCEFNAVSSLEQEKKIEALALNNLNLIRSFMKDNDFLGSLDESSFLIRCYFKEGNVEACISNDKSKIFYKDKTKNELVEADDQSLSKLECGFLKLPNFATPSYRKFNIVTFEDLWKSMHSPKSKEVSEKMTLLGKQLFEGAFELALRDNLRYNKVLPHTGVNEMINWIQVLADPKYSTSEILAAGKEYLSQGK